MKYHTGIDMKAVQDVAPREEPKGTYVNRPVQVEDDLESIVRALGGDPKLVTAMKQGTRSGIPVAEF